ncbi:probable ADP,ATP carrier protein At5g56450 [Dioscorea cayenensis subsp. rotundata]|uniref:ADP/ATP translocase n=1 Tax=Dioscorea cayennensis subsp. rotundata TaxID=55577 RepID=A0AB40BA91_DIOCR|nr:probable ADP,ATP carrier protein At5g56450 [Dioscorea cayenensis subsp. rotundata]
MGGDEDEDEGTRRRRRRRRRNGEEGWAGEFQRDMLAGAAMGGVVHTVVAPIERAKLLLQTQESNASVLGLGGRPRRRRFRGMLDCIARTVRDEGVMSLWRGNGTSVLRYYPSVALNFSLKDLYRAMLKGGEASQNSHIFSGAAANFIAGSAAGCTTLVIIYPLDIAHTRLAADLGSTDSREFRGICHFLRAIYKKDGIRGIYRGLPASLHGMIVHRGLYFGGFDTAKEYMTTSDHSKMEEAPLWKRWLVAQAVTTSAGLISYPLDTVRRRMMMQSGMQELMYKNTLDCWKKIYMMEGVASFYRGAVSNMFRSTGAAAILVLYDEVKKFMKWGGL